MQKKKLRLLFSADITLKDFLQVVAGRVEEIGGVAWKIERLMTDGNVSDCVGVKVSYEIRDGCPECREAEIFEHIMNRHKKANNEKR
jgi:hypothetical protein